MPEDAPDLYVVDPEKRLRDLSEQDADLLFTEVEEAWTAAVESRRDREDRALANYKLYRLKEQEAETARQSRGGWSKLRMPLIYWLVETVLPRLGVAPPTLTVTPRTGDAVPYAQAKQMRMNYYIGEGDWEIQAIKTLKQVLVLGDGPVKVPWDGKAKIPRMLSIPWWDFFLSQEAQDWRTAEWQFQRTYWTSRQLRAMGAQEDEKGKPLWLNLERVEDGATGPETQDPTYQDRRDAAGYSSSQPDGTPDGVHALVEAWHADGSYVAFSPDMRVIVRAEKSPFHNRTGKPIRPFVMFQGTPDMQGPYSIPLPEVLEDHQIEVETMRNQWIDQMTMNLNAGIVHDSSIPEQDVEEFMSAPNGRLAVDGFPDVRAAIQRMQPGQVTGDFPQLYQMVRSESQMTSGVSDIAAGQQSIEGLQNQTATGISIIAGESNRRMQLHLRLAEIGMGEVATVFDSHDRQFGGPLFVPTEQDFVPRNEELGFGWAPKGFAEILSTVNRRDLDYKIAVDAGSAVRPDQLENAQRDVAFVGIMSHELIAPFVDWKEIATKVATSHGMNPERVLLTEEELQQQQEQQMIQALTAAAQGGQGGQGGQG